MSSSEGSDVETESTQTNAKGVKNLLPIKSKEKYLKVYEHFMSWKRENKANSFAETVFLEYFNELCKNKKPSTLWAIYSMLKCTVQIKNGVDMNDYKEIISFLNQQASGSKCNQTRPKILTGENIEQFLKEAPDDKYLATKVALILGVNGACRSIELCNITTKDIECYEDVMVVNLRDSRTKMYRTFIVRDEYLAVVKKYKNLRPVGIPSDRFFLNFKNGKCTKQVIGRNKLALMPKEIATYLDLPDSQLFTGHCFRRSSAILLADSGANATVLKRLGLWESNKMPVRYMKKSIENKSKIINKINHNMALELSSELKKTSHPTTSCQSSHLQPSISEQGSSFQPSTAHKSPQPSASSEKQHININVPGVKSGQQREDYNCTGCNNTIRGFRYICVECADFHLCVACEATGMHELHYMLRIPKRKSHEEVTSVLEKIREELFKTQKNSVESIKVEIKEEPDPMGMGEEIEVEITDLMDTQPPYTGSRYETQDYCNFKSQSASSIKMPSNRAADNQDCKLNIKIENEAMVESKYKDFVQDMDFSHPEVSTRCPILPGNNIMPSTDQSVPTFTVHGKTIRKRTSNIRAENGKHCKAVPDHTLHGCNSREVPFAHRSTNTGTSKKNLPEKVD